MAVLNKLLSLNVQKDNEMKSTYHIDEHRPWIIKRSSRRSDFLLEATF